ncbi:MAG: hypothetical protein R6U03_05835 [Gillisia sp.]
MAEIKIEKKKPVWPWIMLAAVVIALLVLLFANPWDDDEDYEEVEETTEMVTTEKTDLQNTREENSTVIAYVEWINTNKGQMGIDHEFTHQAITKLANATQAMANEIDFNIEAELSKAKQYADEIMKEPYETSHADKIRKATDMLSRALVNMQQAKYPGLKEEAQEVRSASTKIKPEEFTLDQKEDVKDFFRKAADLLQKMN